MELFGYLGATVMGLTLGLIGGGGSILTVPILTYLFKVPVTLAAYYSLFIVGICSAVGATSFARRNLVEFNTAFLFLFPALIGVFFSRRVILPKIAEAKDMIVLMSFAVVMVAASYSMIRKEVHEKSQKKEKNSISVALNGIGVGLVTGFVGAGGGFLIVPALVNGIGLSMEKAVGTSLLIIALNSLMGFAGDFIAGVPVEWSLVLQFLGISLIGISVGAYLNRFVSASNLKRIFGWFVLVLGSFIFIKQIVDYFVASIVT